LLPLAPAEPAILNVAALGKQRQGSGGHVVCLVVCRDIPTFDSTDRHFAASGRSAEPLAQCSA
jgi:hypothetical protein